MTSSIKVYIPDATYPDAGEGEEADALSASFRAGLEAEFDLAFTEANIGPGFDIPALVADIPVAAWIGAALLSGKLLEESIEGYLSLYKKLRRFFHRKPVFDRQGAAIVALGAVVEEIGKTPKAISFEHYRAIHSYIPEARLELRAMTGIGNELDPIQLGVYTHVFDIRADGQLFRIFIEGHRAEIEKPAE